MPLMDHETLVTPGAVLGKSLYCGTCNWKFPSKVPSAGVDLIIENEASRVPDDLYAAVRPASGCLAPCGKNGIGFRLAGNWETARDFSDRGLAVAGTRAPVLSDRVMLECEVGDFDQGRAFMERFLAAPVSIPTVSGYVTMVIQLPPWPARWLWSRRLRKPFSRRPPLPLFWFQEPGRA